MVRHLFLFVLFLSCVPARGASIAAITHDAEASLFYGDFYHSYRDYSYLENESESSFAREGVGGYLKSLFVIGGEKQIASECRRLSTSQNLELAAKSAYLCGYHYLKLKYSDNAEAFFKSIKGASNFYWPAQILLASTYLIANEPQAAIDTLKTADFSHYAHFGLEDEFYLTRARAFTVENDFDDALKNYQALNGKSPFYIETLEETAWAFFKMRRFESSKVLLDVLIGHYESAQRLGNVDVPVFTYYRARYLKAYQALVEKRTEGAAAEFAELRNEYGRTLAKIKPQLNSEKSLVAIRDGNMTWTDVDDLPESLKQQLEWISDWMGADVATRFKNQIYFQMAISRELTRAAKYDRIYSQTAPGYGAKLQTLQDASWVGFARNYDNVVEKLAKDVDTIKIKAELGRLEIVWLKRAEGARSLDEVIDSYQQEAHGIDDYLGTEPY